MNLAEPLFVIPDKKYVLAELLTLRQVCLDSIKESKLKNGLVFTEVSGEPDYFLKGAEAALALLDRKISMSRGQASDAERLMQNANKMVITTTNWYKQQPNNEKTKNV